MTIFTGKLERLETKTVTERWVGLFAEEIMGLCVVGRGIWLHLEIDRSEEPLPPNADGWNFCPPTPDHNEVLAFVGIIMNTMHSLRQKRLGPRLGAHIMDPNDFIGC